MSIQCVQGVGLSRETVSNVFSKLGVNDYPCKHKRWKFFRAEETDELWQIDFKGPFTVHGKKYWFLICIGDYSRFLVVAEQFNHEPRTKEVTALLKNRIDFRRQYYQTMGNSSRRNGNAGADNTVLSRSLRIRSILRIKAKWKGAYRT